MNYTDKRILITGGTGSLGSALVKHFLDLGAKEVRIFSRDERKQVDMMDVFGKYPSFSHVLGDVRDKNSVRRAVRGVNYVVHAAALKQVPFCEYSVLETMMTNCLGAQNIVDCAIEEEVEKVIAVSTDKAVKPVNVYGTSKKLLEHLVTVSNYQKGGNIKTVLSCVRYGNVMNSRGSVIPFWREQIKRKYPVFMTDGSMTRFLLTLNKAVYIVDYALENALGGEIFVPEVASAYNSDLLEALWEWLKTPEPERKLEVIGIRPGEKMHEELVSKEEALRTKYTKRDGYFIIPSQFDPTDNYKNFPIMSLQEFTSSTAYKLNKQEIIHLLDEMQQITNEDKKIWENGFHTPRGE